MVGFSEGLTLSPPHLARAMIDLSRLPVVDDPNLPQWQARVRIIEKHLPRLAHGSDAADRLERERRTLLRLIHNLPMGMLLP